MCSADGSSIGAVGGGLPAWATAPIDEPSAEHIGTWAGARSWNAEAVVVRGDPALVGSEVFRATLDVLRDLYPGDAGLARIDARLALFDEHGLDEALRLLDDAYLAFDTLQVWIATPSWDESKDYLAQHREVLQRDDVHGILGGDEDDPESLTHLGILVLDQALGIDVAYEVVTDPSACESQVDRAVRAGDGRVLQGILLAAPHLLERPVVGDLAMAVLALLADDLEPARTRAAQAHEAASPNRQQAIAIHLRRLAEARPDHREGALELASIFDPPAP